MLASTHVFRRLHILILRIYVFVAWNIWVILKCLRHKRSTWIDINNLDIVDERNGLVVLNKKPNLLINHTKPWFYSLTLQMQLFFHRPQYANPKLENMFHFVHRLDYATSGLICIAYNKSVAGAMGKAFEKKVVGKQYLAVVWDWVGHQSIPNAEQHSPFVYRIDLALSKSTDSNRRIMSTLDPQCPESRSCVTLAVVLEYGHLGGYPATRMLLIPLSGRRHQLRVHCASGLGHPIAGDLNYSGAQRDQSLPRMLLHAYRLCVNMRSARGRAALLPSVDNDLEYLSWKTSDVFPPTNLSWKVDQCVSQLDDWQDVFHL